MRRGGELKLGFESQLFLKGNKTGIAWYADNILRELAKDSNMRYQCNYFSLFYSKKKLDQLSKYENMGINMNNCKWFHDVLYKLIWPFIPLPYHCFFGKNNDVTLFFNYVVPPGVWGKKITVVHDMSYKVYPETVRNKTRKWLQLVLKQSCERSDIIVTISQFSKQEIIKHLKIPEGKIKIVPCGVDMKKFNSNHSILEIEHIKDKYKIQGDYFLYLGTLEPRKNIVRLIEAYNQLLLQKEGIEQKKPFLVLAGGKGWLYESIFNRVKELAIEENVIFTGYVDEDEVPILIKGAKAFVFPSLYEGFGMPPLEAMACGTPVITSNVSSLPEVVGNAGVLINPEDTNDIMCAMKYIMNLDKTSLNKLIFDGYAQAKKFTWENSADKFMQICNELLS